MCEVTRDILYRRSRQKAEDLAAAREDPAAEFARRLKDAVAGALGMIEAAECEEDEDWRRSAEIVEAAVGNVERVETPEAAGFGTRLQNAFVVRLADGTSLMVEVTRAA